MAVATTGTTTGSTTTPGATRERVRAVRSFNRFYTRAIGALGDRHLASGYSLTEVRVLFELAHAAEPDVPVGRLRADLGLDASYLSRILRRFDRADLVRRERSSTDSRRQLVALTVAGRRTVAELEAAADEHIAGVLSALDEGEQARLVASMRAIERGWPARPVDPAPEPASGPASEPAPEPAECTLRPMGPGDYGWVVYRHGALYVAEYGWDERFEALVAEVIAAYVDRRDAAREAGWIAELSGAPAGCVFCMRDDHDPSGTTAKLRLLLVEPTARGAGVGSRLVTECLDFARDAGYRRMVLWTNDVLTSARRIYARAGFELVDSAKHHSFGHDLVGETWSRPLGGAR